MDKICPYSNRNQENKGSYIYSGQNEQIKKLQQER